MENAQLINLSRQSALRNQLDVVANNMANITTTGFKSQRLMFEEFVMPVAEATAFKNGDEDLSYVHDYSTSFNFLQGSIRTTGNDFDLAVEGAGFFAIQMADGTEGYTRNGSFHVNTQGTLVEASGRPVLTDGGPITFTAEDGKVDIARDGTIVSELGVRGRIRVVDFENPQLLDQIGDNLYVGEGAVPIDEVMVLQGALEQSNVQGVVEIARMIEITRAYDSVSKLMSETDELRRKAIESLGNLQA